MTFFYVLLFITASYEVSKILYPAFDMEERRVAKKLKEEPVVVLSAESGQTSVSVVPGQKVMAGGKVIFATKPDAGYWAYTILNLLYLVFIIAGLLSGNAGIVVSMICIMAMSEVMKHTELSKALIRLDAICSLCILVPMMCYLV